MRISARMIVAGVAVAAVIAVAVVVPGVVRRLNFFRVRQIEVVGVRYLDESDVVQRLGLRHNASVLDKLAPVRAAATAIPGVLSASVERVLPGTLRVTVREAAPIALAATPDRLMLMDSVGHLLPFDPTRAPASLPISVRDSGVAALLARLRRADDSLYRAIESVRVDKGDVVLDVGSRRIRLRPEANDSILQSVTAVINYLSSKAIAWREIDARYHDRIFVAKGAA